MKIVINKCYGGFSISPLALHHLARLKNLTLYKEDDGSGFALYYTTPTFEEHSLFDDHPLDRTDPDLIATIEALGPSANGTHAALEVLSLHSGQLYRICEHDGREWLEFPEDITWLTAT